MQTFADQAVIAIENTRLFEEEQARTRELQKSSSSRPRRRGAEAHQPLDVQLQPVLDTLVASRLAPVRRTDGRHPRPARRQPARSGAAWLPDRYGEALSKTGQVMDRGSLAGRTIAEGNPVHIPDVEADAEYDVPRLHAHHRGAQHAGRAAVA